MLALDDDEAELRAASLRAGLADYELDDEDAALLAAGEEPISEEEPLRVAPVLAIVGRPNVGKSTLVNRILGRREAVVEDTPGVTRDRVSYSAHWNGRAFTLVDTGGWEHDAKGIHARVAEQAEIAVDMADAVLFVVDANVGATATDEAVVQDAAPQEEAGHPGGQQGGRHAPRNPTPLRCGDSASASRTLSRHCTAAAWPTCSTTSWRCCRSSPPTGHWSAPAVPAASR